MALMIILFAFCVSRFFRSVLKFILIWMVLGWAVRHSPELLKDIRSDLDYAASRWMMVDRATVDRDGSRWILRSTKDAPSESVKNL
jgi:hypothetical protein